MMSVIIPYVRNPEDQQWSVPDNLMAAVFTKMEENGLDRIVFANGTVSNYLQWLQFAQHRKNLVHLIINEKSVEMVAWLNSFGHNYAFAHFCCFPSTWGKNSIELGRQSITYWFDELYVGDWCLDVIMGQVPAKNKKAIAYTKKCGMRELGTVPAIKYKRSDGPIGAYFCYITREDFENGRQRRRQRGRGTDR